MNKTNKPIYLLILSIILIINQPVIRAAGNNNLQQAEVTFPTHCLTLKKALETINQHPSVSVVYGDIDESLLLEVCFSSKTLTVKKALDEIELAVPVDVVLNNNHIIVKKRVLEKSYKLEGTVRDANSNERLAAAYLYISGSKQGWVTDRQGHFSINLKPGRYQLTCRFIGYREESVAVNVFQDTNIEFNMKVEQQELREINVTGNIVDMSNIEKGRSIDMLDSKTINKLNTNDVNDALHGSLNGVWNSKISGAPGDHHKIRIRGISSILGSNDPLYVVDGMIVPIVNMQTLGIADLNSHDVNSITVLKDASSTALYGYQGGNGVIIIETKKGGGPNQFNLSVKKGIQHFGKRYNLMNSEDFLSIHEISDKNLGTAFYKIVSFNNKYELYPYYRDSLGNTLGSDDFQEEIFQMGNLSEIQLSGQGQVKGFDYYISGNFFDHEGVVVNTRYRKISLTANISKVINDKLSLRLLYKGSHQENMNNLDNYLGNPVIYKGINYEPAYRTTPDSFLIKQYRLFYNDTGSTISKIGTNYCTPDELFYGIEKSKPENIHSISFMGTYRLNKSIDLRANVTYSDRKASYLSNLINSIKGNTYLHSNEQYQVFCQQYDIHFNKKYKQHNVNAFIRFRNYNDKVKWEIDSTRNISVNGLDPEDENYLRGSQSIYGENGSVTRMINSSIFNLNYNFEEKYFISFIGNYDHIKEGHYVDKNDLFTSFAINWDISKERFLHFPKWIDAFNLYANWGRSGNYPLNGLSNDLYSMSESYTANNQQVNSAYIANLANHNIRPEKVTESNYGASISLFQERIGLSADYYTKTNSDLLVQRDIPYYYGGGNIFVNIGEMKNSGFELSLELVPFDLPGFYWYSKAGFSTNNQYITKLDNGTPITFYNSDIMITDFKAVENLSLGAIYGYNYQGKWDDLTQEQLENEKVTYVENLGLAYLKNDTLYPTILTTDDKMVIGNSIPKYTFNWLNVFEFKNFSIEMLWYAVQGVDKFNATKACTYAAGTNYAVRQIVLDTMLYLTKNHFYESSFFVEDASFIRLKTLSFTYYQPKKIASKINMAYTLSFENLITITDYSGYDPEATIYTDNNFTDNAIDLGAYPNPQGVFLSISMTF